MLRPIRRVHALVPLAFAASLLVGCGDVGTPGNEGGTGGVSGTGTGGVAGTGTGGIPVLSDAGPPPGRTPGQTDFESEELRSGTTGGADAGALGGAGGSSAATPGRDAPGGRVATVEEADIYRLDGNRLFYFNTYRGFLVYDISDPKNPAQVSRLPVYGYPVEMFVSGNRVYALLRDALYLTESAGKLEFHRHNVSQLVTIDVSDIKNPRVIGTTDIVGQLREGVSRKIDDTIYVVSYVPQFYWWGWSYTRPSGQQKEQAWVYSFDVSQPEARLVQQLKLFEGGSVQVSDPGTGFYHRTFSDVAISATSNALMVVENWYVSSFVSAGIDRCSSFDSNQQAIVSIVDVSDPTGKIQLHTRFQTWGRLTDQFKQTYAYDPVAKTGTYFGIFARQTWGSAGCAGGTFVTHNTLESWDVTNGASPRRLARLDFGKPNETVRGSAFDLDRNVAYAITARNVDPLYTLDLSDRTKLRVLSEIDGLSGDMSVFRLIGDRKFLIGVGTDNSAACQGFQGSNDWVPTKMAVSIIDVRDLARIRLVQRACVAVKNAGWVSSGISWNMDQAHKMLGMHSDGATNVITVPVSYWKQVNDSGNPNDWWHSRWETAVGIMSWDLARYDDTKPETQQTVIQNHGTFVHPFGEVRRSIVFSHAASGNRRMMINLSDTHVSVADLSNLAAPTAQSTIEVAPYHSALFRFGDFIVERVEPAQTGGYWWYGANANQLTELRVKRAGGDLDDKPVLATVSVGQVQRIVQHGQKLVLFRGGPGANSYAPGSLEALVYDFSVPTQPRREGTVRVPSNVIPYPYFWCGFGGYWSSYWFGNQTTWAQTTSGIVTLTSDWDPAGQTRRWGLVFLDLGRPQAPQVSELALNLDGDRFVTGLVPDAAQPDGFLVTYREDLGLVERDGAVFVRYRDLAQRFAPSPAGWQPTPAFSTPGPLVSTWTDASGARLYLARDTGSAWSEKRLDGSGGGWSVRMRLALLRQVTLPSGALAAALVEAREFGDTYPSGLVRDGGRLYVAAQSTPTDGYYYGLPGGATSDRLMVFDVSTAGLALAYDRPTRTFGMQLMGVHGGRLFLNLPGDGIVVVDASQPAAPRGQSFLRTLGYATHLEFAGDDAYVAAGSFGTYHLSLSAPPELAAE